MNFKAGTLAVRWRPNHNGDGPGLVFHYARPADGHLMHQFFACSHEPGGLPLKDELEARGYDITTLQFTIRKKPTQIEGG